jgi:hypothetical protein
MHGQHCYDVDGTLTCGWPGSHGACDCDLCQPTITRESFHDEVQLTAICQAYPSCFFCDPKAGDRLCESPDDF